MMPGWLFCVVVVLYGVYAGVFIGRSSCVVDGVRWFCLFDDGMISMRYAWNLAHGNGLVWNVGERVEGFTNLGWTLVMAVIHWFDMPLRFTSLVVQVVSFLFLVGNLVFTLLIARELRLPVSVGTAVVIVTAFYYPLNFYSLMGMETGVLACLFSGAVYLILRGENRGRVLWPAWLLLFLAIMVRLDAVVLVFVIAAVGSFVFAGHRRDYIVGGLTTIFAALAIQTFFRWAYYGSFVPNTWYLKMSEVSLWMRLNRGVWTTFAFLFNHLWVLYVVIPIYLLKVRGRLPDFKGLVVGLVRSPMLLPVCLVGVQLLYSAYVGGDVWEREFYGNRFQVVVISFFYIVLISVMVKFVSMFGAGDRFIRKRPVLFGVILGLLFVVQSNRHGSFMLAYEEATLQRKPYLSEEVEDFVMMAHDIREKFPADARIAIDRAGMLPYLLPEYYFIDVLGKADPVIARLESRVLPGVNQLGTGAFVPGHTKWSAEHTLGKLRPDLLILTISIMMEDYRPYLDAFYEEFDGLRGGFDVWVRSRG